MGGSQEMISKSSLSVDSIYWDFATRILSLAYLVLPKYTNCSELNGFGPI